MGSHTREAASVTSIGAVKVCLQKIISTRGEGGRGREGGGRGEGEGREGETGEGAYPLANFSYENPPPTLDTQPDNEVIILFFFYFFNVHVCCVRCDDVACDMDECCAYLDLRCS